MPITGDLTTWVVQFMLFVVRMSAFFILSPIFGRANIPMNLKVLLSVMMAFIAIQYYPPLAALPPTIAGLVLVIVGELAVGFIMGYITTMFFSVVFTAGQIIDTQIGFGMVQIYDIQTNAQVPVAGSLLNLVLLETFLMTDGHHRLIQLLFASFQLIPVGQVQLRPELGTLMLRGFVEVFVLSINVALPIIASGLVAEVALGIVVRTSPQMNIFVVGMPIKTILGLLMLSVLVPAFVSFTRVIFDTMYAFIAETFTLMVP